MDSRTRTLFSSFLERNIAKALHDLIFFFLYITYLSLDWGDANNERIYIKRERGGGGGG